jgi:hypothetical protein
MDEAVQMVLIALKFFQLPAHNEKTLLGIERSVVCQTDVGSRQAVNLSLNLL